MLVPLKHGVDSLAELCTASLVYTASVDPGICDTTRASKPTRLCNLGKPLLGGGAGRAGELLESNLLFGLCVGQNFMLRNFSHTEVPEQHCLCIDQPHLKIC